ncbi:MAG: PQQ-dependent sugar dehydrogenase [Deltaproteobacteria bacterium]|nr:PQQ-dependent sugar dehydrogenase [Deltaproteobacteria bacterium]
MMLPSAGLAQDSPITIAKAFSTLFNEQCAVCHGEDLSGAAQGGPLVGIDLVHGDSLAEIADSIAKGAPEKNMPAWSKTLSADQIRNLALYVSERRLGFTYSDFRIERSLELPTGEIESEEHAFRLEKLIDGLDPLLYSIAPLPDGRILLSEKTRGLSIISREGEQSAPIEGTPRIHDDVIPLPSGARFGAGWMLDVAIHPEYEKNGWIYIQYGDRCSDCNAVSRSANRPVSMNKLVRGRIQDGSWVDQETLWQADVETYGLAPDLSAGGRISFDDNGHVFISVGLKGSDNFTGVQDLSMPYGKIHRMYDDGRVPPDNPFVGVPGAMDTIWTYGHRVPQGLEYNFKTSELWSTEMGPRGGDEVNLLLPGRNYGWPLTSKGVNYDGTPVAYGKQLGLEYELKDIEQPVVDMTPSPAISSFVFYSGSLFPDWRNDIIVGSLKGATLYRVAFEDGSWVHTETLVQDLARIRDVETAPSGEIYLLLEHASGGQILRLVPTQRESAKRSPLGRFLNWLGG